ncbi:MAG: inorganic phosphate transporter [Nitrospirae bacterium]|nr:inorganic phosphate transporter [Nitrospirota bacterium]
MLEIGLIVVAMLVAFANGANDNFKGVATLVGSGTANYRRALTWATAATLAGSLGAIFLAGELGRRFSGKGLVPDAIAGEPSFVLAVALGAALTVLLATWRGFPISTTHALVGALAGAGLAAAGSGLHWSALGFDFFVPLLVSPLIAGVLTVLTYGVATSARKRLGIEKEFCICVGEEEQVVAVGLSPAGEGAAIARRMITVRSDSVGACAERYRGRMLGVSIQAVLGGAHFASAGVVSFARGLNDTPKMVALLLATGAVASPGSNLFVAMAIAAGGLLAAKRVADTMSRRITEMNHGQALSGNLVTAALVVSASLFGLPVSTTHVSVGSLLGIGAVGGGARWGVVRKIVLAWVITLPLSAAFSAGAYWLGVEYL